MGKKWKPLIHNAVLEPGTIYRAMHGGAFECKAATEDGNALLRSVASGARFIAAGITIYENGTITWQQSRELDYEPEIEVRNESFDMPER